MPYVYPRTPFNTSEPVFLIGTGCNPNHPGARDLGFYGIRWGEPVYAVEDGTVVSVFGNSTCFSTEPDPQFPDTNVIPNPNCETGVNRVNKIVIRGNDGFITEYVHVLPLSNLMVGSQVQQGMRLGSVDQSGYTSGAHVHLERYDFGPNGEIRRTCNWTISPDADFFPSTTRGWKQTTNGNWYYFRNNGRPQLGGWPLDEADNAQYQLDSTTGARTGWKYSRTERACYFRGVSSPCPF